jgi:CelD/BcsL family acetyltransferase involved in cellulose biosynthesis
VAKKTYQRGLNSGFFDNEEMRQRFTLFAKRGQLRVLMLEVAGMPKAFWLGSVYGETFHSEATGYTPDVKEFEVGTQVLARLLDELIKEGIRTLDFGFGEAHYKKRFSDHCWREAGVKVFSQTYKGWLLYKYLEIIGRLDDFIRRSLQHLGLFDRIKQSWRAKLRS